MIDSESADLERLDVVDRALVRCRVLGAVALLLLTRRLDTGGTTPAIVVTASFAALLLGTNWLVASAWSRARFSSRARAVAGLVADLGATLAVLTLAGVGPDSQAMVLLLLPILEAGVRFRVLGACLTWFAGVAAVAVPVIAQVPDTGDAPVGDLLALAPLLLLAALPVAYIAEHLSTELTSALTANRAANARASLLAELIAAERHLTSLDLRQVARAACEACLRLGAEAVDLHIVDRVDGVQRFEAMQQGALLPVDANAEIKAALRARGAIAMRNGADGGNVVLSCAATVHPGAWVLRAVVPTASAYELVADGIEVLAAQLSRSAANANAHTEVERRRRELAWRADHDDLTGLENRAGVRCRLDALAASGRTFWVAFIDLDGFKSINDRLGHDAGDAVLCAVADRLSMALARDAVAARLGGDEFLVVPADGHDSPEAIVERIGRVLRPPVALEGGSFVSVGASVGYAWCTDGNIDAVLGEADAAMYEVKRSSSGSGAKRPGQLTELRALRS